MEKPAWLSGAELIAGRELTDEEAEQLRITLGMPKKQKSIKEFFGS
jgi:hypothetical protein